MLHADITSEQNPGHDVSTSADSLENLCSTHKIFRILTKLMAEVLLGHDIGM